MPLKAHVLAWRVFGIDSLDSVDVTWGVQLEMPA